MPNTYLSKTYSGNGNLKKGTISVWVKFGDTGASADSAIFGTGNTSNDSDFTMLTVNGNGISGIVTRNVMFVLRKSGGTVYEATSNLLVKDTSAWYHIVARYDTTLSTPNCDIYVNGEEVTYETNNWSSLSQNTDTYLGGTNYAHFIGRGCANANQHNYHDGLMTHLHYCDGYYYGPDSFGSTDATTGEWKINTSPSVSYGTNGFFTLKNNAGTTDQSPNSNTYAVAGGTILSVLDNPSNNFATWNPNLAMNSTMSLANGNTSATTASNYAAGASNVWFSTLGMSSGKFYCEMKLSAASANQGEMVGVGYDLSKFQQGSTVNAYNIGYISEGWSYMGAEGKVKNNNSDVLTGMPTWGTNDIVCIAIDLDNYKLYFRKNGDAWINSGNPESGATGTGAVSLTSGKTYFFACSDASSGNTYTYQANFGNGFFGTTAVASAGTNASNLGTFEYDVPSGYTALCTKGLNL